MAKIIQFKSLEERMSEESREAITAAVETITSDATRHLIKHYPGLFAKYGTNLIQVWASFMFQYIASVSLEEAIKSLGSEEKYFEMLEELSRIKKS